MFKSSKKICLPAFAAILSVAVAVVYHFPFYRYVLANVDADFNGAMIVLGLTAILLAGNYLAFYLFLWAGRGVGRALAAFLFIGNSVALYFINTYDVIIDDTMMGNVFNTDTAEAGSYWSWAAALYVALAGILPAAAVIFAKIDFGPARKFFTNIGVSLAVIAAVAFGNMSNWMWIDNNSTIMGSLILPWSYVVNTFRYYGSVRERGREEIRLPDASIGTEGRTAVVLIIGESARRDHFSLYGYGRETNPLLAAEPGVKAYKAESAATYTTAGVKAILSHTDEDKLYEILPNYLYRTGIDVVWKANNWGEPPLHIRQRLQCSEIAEANPGLNPGWDETLTAGLEDEIRNSDNEKILVVIHLGTSHGPSYQNHYPPRFGKWEPVPTTVEMSKCPIEQLVNAYDNSVLYTDWLIDDVIERLKTLDGWKKAMIYVGDHGESLGENGLYMHGVPISIAPAEQYEIPFIVWSSEPGQQYRFEDETISQYHVFHSVLHFFGVESPIYEKDLDIFE